VKRRPTTHKPHHEAKRGEQHHHQRSGDENTVGFRPKGRIDGKRPATSDVHQQIRSRIFARAQGRTSVSPPAPSVSAEHRTTSESARRQGDGMESPLSTAETQTSASSTVEATPYVQIGNDLQDVRAQDIITSVPAAETQITAPKNAHSHSLKITTPLRHEEWSQLLAKHLLLPKYPNIPQYIQHGADAGIPRITQTYTPPNCPSILVHSSAFEEIVNREFDKGRYAGPFTHAEVEERIGPFQTSPLSLVPKAGKPNRFRLIQNLSFPRNNPVVRSINHALHQQNQNFCKV